MMKKTIAMLLSAVLLLTCFACAKKEPTAETLTVTPKAGQVIYSHLSPDQVQVQGTVNYSAGSTVDVTEKLKTSGTLTPGSCEIKYHVNIDGNQLVAKTNVDVLESPFLWEKVPEEWLTEPTQRGTVERFAYESYTYDETGTPGEAGSTEAYVYLPAGYDPSGTYNILYLMHGAGENAGYWFGAGDYAAGGVADMSAENVTTTLLDNLIAAKAVEPLIVVAPTIHAISEDNGRPTGLNGYETFRYEFQNELVPGIETKYATYAGGDVSRENLIATRAHRAYAGLSMGSMTGFASIMMGCTDIVAYIGNYSAGTSNIDALVESLTGSYADYPILYWYNGEGTKDNAHDGHIETYQALIERCPEKFQEGIDPVADNAFLVDKTGHIHNYQSWIVDLYNTLQCFFRK